VTDSALGLIALFGARGAVGHALAAQLDQLGVSYRAVGRDLDALRREFPKADARAADFLSGQGVSEAAAGAGTIVYLAGAPYTHFEHHPVMTRHALAAAKEAGVRRFVHVAPVYSYGPVRTRPVPETQPHEPQTRKGRWRLEQEQVVLQAHDPTALRTLVMHLPDFYGPHADNSLANYFMREALGGKPASFIGPLAAQREFLYVPDVAEPLLALASHDDAYGQCWNLGGNAPITGRAFAQLVFEAIGRPPKYRSIPKIALQAVGLFNPFMREVAEMYYLYESSFVLDDSKLRRRIEEVKKTPYEQGVRATIAWMREHPASALAMQQ